MTSHSRTTPIETTKAQLLDAVRDYHEAVQPDRRFRPGVTPLYSSGPVFDEEDRAALVEAALDMRIVAGRSARAFDEVVTVAAGFPTTVNPLLQNGLVPVFVDVELGTYNTTPDRIAAAIGPAPERSCSHTPSATSPR